MSENCKLDYKVFLRINGVAHAYPLELGCTCNKCTALNYNLTKPTGLLEAFGGWDDPISRANTSASILIADKNNKLLGQILIDAGLGILNSLVASKLPKLDNIFAILNSHWHPDHCLNLNVLCETVKRTKKRNSEPFEPIPYYATLPTYLKLYHDGGQSRQFKYFLQYHQIIPDTAFEPYPGIKITPINVAHGKIKGSTIFLADIGKYKVIFCWDIDLPKAKLPSSNPPILNKKIIEKNLPLLKEADILFIAINTWGKTGTGHTNFLQAYEHYIKPIQAKQVYAMHHSGHEDSGDGFGWSDTEWDSRLQPFWCSNCKTRDDNPFRFLERACLRACFN